MTTATKFLDRLERVKQTAPGRWVACCPAHQDRSPSLSIRDLDDRVLIYCHAGCGAPDIMEALGLSLTDLFDRRHGDKSVGNVRTAIPAADLLTILDHEITVTVLILHDLVTRRRVSEGQIQRLTLAAARIAKARDMVSPAKVASHAA